MMLLKGISTRKNVRKRKINLRAICNYCKELSHWEKGYPKRRGKDSLVAMTHNGSTWIILKRGSRLWFYFSYVPKLNRVSNIRG